MFHILNEMGNNRHAMENRIDMCRDVVKKKWVILDEDVGIQWKKVLSDDKQVKDSGSNSEVVIVVIVNTKQRLRVIDHENNEGKG